MIVTVPLALRLAPAPSSARCEPVPETRIGADWFLTRFGVPGAPVGQVNSASWTVTFAPGVYPAAASASPLKLLPEPSKFPLAYVDASVTPTTFAACDNDAYGNCAVAVAVFA